MKIFTLKPNENWICDRFANEWETNNRDLVANHPNDADVIWLLGSWCWKNIPIDILKTKKVITTIHHIVPEKFDEARQKDFLMRDLITDAYHVPCMKTKQQIENLTSKKIYDFPFWVNQNIWKETEEKIKLREKYNIGADEFVVGSFQRDTEGHDLKSPKMEKGPDIFCNIAFDMSKRFNNFSVLLAGWRRQYVISKLEEMNIPYRYHELPDFSTLNELYNCLDLYLVTSRYEGGPQSILECAANKTPILSTDVGIAPEILHESSIIKNDKEVSTNVDFAYNSIANLFMPAGFDNFHKMFYEIKNDQQSL